MCVIVPQVQFEESQYSLQFPGSSVSVCLMYSNTENGGFVQFEAEILIAREGLKLEPSVNYIYSKH